MIIDSVAYRTLSNAFIVSQHTQYVWLDGSFSPPNPSPIYSINLIYISSTRLLRSLSDGNELKKMVEKTVNRKCVWSGSMIQVENVYLEGEIMCDHYGRKKVKVP